MITKTQIQHYIFVNAPDMSTISPRMYLGLGRNVIQVLSLRKKTDDYMQGLKKVELGEYTKYLAKFIEDSKKEENEKHLLPTVYEYIKNKTGNELDKMTQFSVLTAQFSSPWGEYEFQITAVCNEREMFDKTMANIILRGRLSKIITYIRTQPSGNNKFANYLKKNRYDYSEDFWTTRDGLNTKMEILSKIYPWFHFKSKVENKNESDGKQ